jgi:hypothetical protein
MSYGEQSEVPYVWFCEPEEERLSNREVVRVVKTDGEEKNTDELNENQINLKNFGWECKGKAEEVLAKEEEERLKFEAYIDFSEALEQNLIEADIEIKEEEASDTFE